MSTLTEIKANAVDTLETGGNIRFMRKINTNVLNRSFHSSVG
jgi:hypothetical protein